MPTAQLLSGNVFTWLRGPGEFSQHRHVFQQQTPDKMSGTIKVPAMRLEVVTILCNPQQTRLPYRCYLLSVL